tara:strand:+ start:40 stop:315 length:276 start_codon:yes stop_codon:yes gene_type:complete
VGTRAKKKGAEMKPLEIIEEYNKNILPKTDFVVSWHAKKYNKVIFRVGNLNKEGCRTWESNGNKYMCFWDTVLERYTTCINPMITYKRDVN